MIDEPKRRGLGRGLSALFGDDDRAGPAGEAVQSLPIEFLEPGRYQPRRRFDEDTVAQLAESIRERGILQPMIVRRLSGDRYEIIAGERRWRAAQMAGLHEVPALVREMSDREALEAAIVENVQREDLNAIDEADGYRRLVEEFGHTQEVVARIVGKSRSHIANALRLLALPDGVKGMVSSGALTAGHARALLTLPDPAAAAADVVKKGLNVRQTELLARSGAAPRRRAPAPANDADTAALEADLTRALGLRVSISPDGTGGTLTIRYTDLDQLDAVIARLRG
jgi:ParB family transcriptional regulator, chromosome partitioning protein